MQLTQGPNNPNEDYATLLAHKDALAKDKLTSEIPQSMYEPRVSRGLAGFAVSYCVYAVAILGLVYAPHWILYLPLWIMAGLGGWGLHCIAHDCGHGSFSRSSRLNTVIGQLALLPTLYPFHAWKHAHNTHHAKTGHLDLDVDWRPIDPKSYLSLSRGMRLTYYLYRSYLVWLGSVTHWLAFGFIKRQHLSNRKKKTVKQSVLFIVVFSLIMLSTLVHFAGFSGLLIYFVGPLLAIHAWFSITTFLHHVAEDLPFLPEQHWNRTASRLLLTIDHKVPHWLHFLTQNIFYHTAHHVSPAIPFYNLPQCTEILKQKYPEAFKERPLTLSVLWQTVTRCQLYDPETGYYMSFKELKAQTENTKTAPASS